VPIQQSRTQIPSEPRKYKLVNLQTYIENKIHEKEERIRFLKQDSKKIKEPINEDIFECSLIKGQRAIMNKLAEFNPKVKKEIIGVQGSWKVWGKGLREMQNCVKRGVNVRLIGVVDNDTLKRAKEWKKTGSQIRIWNKNLGLPPRFTIFDNKFARITFGKPEVRDSKEYITIWTNSKPLIYILKSQFEIFWKRCKTF